jgi:WD40 repeat protein
MVRAVNPAKGIVTAGLDKTARVWNAATGQLLANLEGRASQVLRAAWSPDGRHIVTASVDRTVRVWRIVTLDDIDKLLR